MKVREAEAKDEAKLSDFQEELVQMAAVLCGDPEKGLQGMNVKDGVDYVKKAFQKFLDECEKARLNGAHESTICIPTLDHQPKSKTFASKLFSCIVCRDQ